MAVVLGGRAIMVAMAVGMLAALATAQDVQDQDVAGGGVYQPRDPCPQVESIVQKAVAEEFKKNKDITGGLLRVFFHDCFSWGCDASIFLRDEWIKFPVQDRVRSFVNEIRSKVNKECGDQSVSCADILALATRDAVDEAGGRRVPIARGRFDSLRAGDVKKIPFPTDRVSTLLTTFAGFGLNAADLVALSGAHTVGKTRKACQFVDNPAFKARCNSRDGQDLDVISPVIFDNQYFVGLTRNPSLGMFSTDRNLFSDANPATKKLVQTYARDQNEFFNQWDISFRKLSQVNWTSFSKGEIRRDCTRTNTGRLGAPLGLIQDQ